MWIINPKRTNRRTDLSKNDRLVVKNFIPLKMKRNLFVQKHFLFRYNWYNKKKIKYIVK